MLDIAFRIESVPDDWSGYRAAAYTEGSLEVYVGKKLFLRVDEALLVELAIALKKWVHNPIEDLYYSSMDFEEEPILALRHRDGLIALESVWTQNEMELLPLKECLQACSVYLEEMQRELARYGINLKDVLSASLPQSF